MVCAIAGCQFEPVVGDVERNIATLREIAASLPEPVELAVFPELCVSGYDLDAAVATATPVPGPITDRLERIAASIDVTLVVGLAEQTDDAVYNDLVTVSPTGTVRKYRKQYLWGAEDATFTADTDPTTVETPVGTVGFLLCYDLNFPEAALAYARKRVDVLAVSAAWRAAFRHDWDVLLQARALDTTCYVIGSNHAGSQCGRTHNGGSLIAGPDGTVLKRVRDGTAVVSTEFDPEFINDARKRNPVAETRRK
ncbi:MAG: carbon-nitrogen hydrolase family protein [Halodesulfurarchaeum sp.]